MHSKTLQDYMKVPKENLIHQTKGKIEIFGVKNCDQVVPVLQGQRNICNSIEKNWLKNCVSLMRVCQLTTVCTVLPLCLRKITHNRNISKKSQFSFHSKGKSIEDPCIKSTWIRTEIPRISILLAIQKNKKAKKNPINSIIKSLPYSTPTKSVKTNFNKIRFGKLCKTFA